MDPYDHPQSPHVFHILLALKAGAGHGYAIIGAVEEHSAGRLRLTTGTLYSALKRLLASGWIEETDDDDPRRRSYRLTPSGRALLRAETVRLQHMLDAAGASRAVPEQA